MKSKAKYLVLIMHIFLALIIIIESLIDGTDSAKQSNAIGNFFAGIINRLDVSKMVEPTSCELVVNKQNVVVGEALTFSVNTIPSECTYKSYEYHLSNDNATLSNQTITFTKPGEVSLTCYNTFNKEVKDKITFSIDIVKEETFDIVFESDVLYYEHPNPFQIQVTPKNITNRSIKYIIIEDGEVASESKYLEVYSNYIKVKRVSKNPITIKFCLNNNLEITKEFTTAYKYYQKLENVELEENVDVYLDEVYLPSINYTPFNASIKDYRILDNEYCYLDDSGYFHFLKTGQVEVELLFDNNLRKTINFNILDYDDVLNYSINSLTININAHETIYYRGNYNLMSLNEDIVKIENNSLVGVSKGVGKIKISNNKEEEVIEVRVVNNPTNSLIQLPSELEMLTSYPLTTNINYEYDINYLKIENDTLYPLRSGTTSLNIYNGVETLTLNLNIKDVEVTNYKLLLDNEEVGNINSMNVYEQKIFSLNTSKTLNLPTKIELEQEEECLKYNYQTNSFTSLRSGKCLVKVINGSFIAKFEIEVINNLPSSLQTNILNYNVEASTSIDLTTNLDDHPYFSSLIITSSNSQVARVKNKTIYFLKGGKVQIQLQSYIDPQVSLLLEFNVTNKLGFSYKIDGKSDVTSLKITRGEAKKISIEYLETTTYRNVSFTSSDPNILTIDSLGNISALENGKCVITIESNDNVNKFTKTIDVEVSKKSMIDDLGKFLLKSRKLVGHFMLFLAFALFVSLTYIYFLKKNLLSIGMLISLIEGYVFASTSELLQLVTPNRGASLNDVAIDLGGYVIGFIITYLIYNHIRKKKNIPSE